MTGQLAVYDSASRELPAWRELKQAWNYRDLIVQLVVRDIRARYKRSILGVGWTMLNPLLMMLVLTVVFSSLFRFDLLHYPVYLLSGTILWTFLQQASTAAMTQLIWGGALLNKIYVPRTVFALAAVGTGLVNLTLSLVPLAVIVLVTGAPLSPWILILPVPILLAGLFVLGVGLLVSTLAVSFPDVVEIYQVLLSAWYFLTPVLYPKSIVPAPWRDLYNFNPAYHLVEAFRLPVYAGGPAGWNTLTAAAVASIAVAVIGWLVFTSRADQLGYRL